MADETLLYRFEETGLDDLRREMNGLAEDFEDVGDEATQAGAEIKSAMEGAEDSVEELDDRAIDFDVRSALASLQRVSGALDDIQRKINRLDGRTIDIDSDVDRVRRTGGGGGRSRGGSTRLPGELDEVQESFNAFAALPNRAKAALVGLAGAGAAAAAALGSAGGLAAVATQLANEIGPRGLQSDVKAVRADFIETGRAFSRTFSDVIRDFVLPAGRGFARAIRGADEALAGFTRTVFSNLESLGATGGPLGILSGTLQGAIAGGQQSTGGSLAQGTSDIPGIRETVLTLNRQINRVRERFRRDLIPKRDMLSQIKSFRQEAFVNLQKLKQRFPEAFPPALLDRFAEKLRDVKEEIDALSVDLSKIVDEVGLPAALERTPDVVEPPNPPEEADVPPPEEAMPPPSTTQSFADRLGSQLERSVARSLDRAFQSLGRSVSQAIFGGGRGPGVASQRLRLFNAKKQMRSLRQALKQGQISYKAFSLRVKAQQRRIQKQQEQLNQTMQGGFVGALESMGDAASRIFKQMIADITATVAKMAVLKGLIAAFNISSGGFFGSVITNLGGGGLLPGKATTSSVAAPSPSVQAGSVAMKVTGTIRGEGRSLVATLDREASAQSQFGR